MQSILPILVLLEEVNQLCEPKMQNFCVVCRTDGRIDSRLVLDVYPVVTRRWV